MNGRRGVAVFGEALIDLLASGERSFEGHPGGSPANVAVATARLGRPARFVGGLSTDRWGRLLDDHLRASGVDTSSAPRSDHPTALAVVDLDDAGSAVYRFLWDDTADRAVALADLPAELGDDVAWLQVGSVAAAFEDSGAVAAALLDRERDRRLVSCDPNVRTVVHGHGEDTRARLANVTDHADLVKLSDEDLAFLFPGVSVPDAVARWLDAGVAVVAVTAGGGGATLHAEGGSVDVAVPTTTVADTVGAGDTFMAGLLVGMLDAGVDRRDRLAAVDSDTLAAVGRFAAAAAAVTVSRPGADPPRRDELDPGVLVAAG